MDLAWLVSRARDIVGRRGAQHEAGASLVEYALLLAMVAIACIVALQFLGGSVANSLNNTGHSIWP
jgi:Flp pilus assembly pilin Flp